MKDVVKDGDERVQAFMNAVVRGIAEDAHRRICERAPEGGSWSGYKKSIKLGSAPNDAGVTYVVYSDLVKRSLYASQAEEYVLYVNVVPNPLVPPNPLFAIIQRYNPWTLNTLPVNPDGVRGVEVISRKVRRGEVEAVARQREEQRRQWMKELGFYGWRPADDYGKQLRSAEAELGTRNLMSSTADFAFEVLRVEKNIDNDSGAKPHWKPGIEEARDAVKNIMKDPKVTRILTDASFQDWKKSRDDDVKVPRTAVKRYGSFEKALKIS